MTTLQQALQTPEVRAFIGAEARRAVEPAVVPDRNSGWRRVAEAKGLAIQHGDGVHRVGGRPAPPPLRSPVVEIPGLPLAILESTTADPDARFGDEDTPWVKHCREAGLDPQRFGAPWPADEDEDEIAASLAVREAPAALTDEQRAIVGREPAWVSRLRDQGFSAEELARRGWAA